MNREVVFVLEPDVGIATVEISQMAENDVSGLTKDLGMPVDLNCGRPTMIIRGLPVFKQQLDTNSHCCKSSIWLYRLYHRSTVDGPGRRSVVQVSGCSIRCPGCYVPDTHVRENGSLVSINVLIDEIVKRRSEHDGVTILGGEPFDQPDSIAELVFRLKRAGVHICIYSGYKLEDLMARKEPNVDYILSHIDLLIDGPFANELRKDAGEYRGSRNQRFIEMNI